MSYLSDPGRNWNGWLEETIYESLSRRTKNRSFSNQKSAVVTLLAVRREQFTFFILDLYQNLLELMLFRCVAVSLSLKSFQAPCLERLSQALWFSFYKLLWFHEKFTETLVKPMHAKPKIINQSTTRRVKSVHAIIDVNRLSITLSPPSCIHMDRWLLTHEKESSEIFVQKKPSTLAF